jgi:hypothetical protein
MCGQRAAITGRPSRPAVDRGVPTLRDDLPRTSPAKRLKHPPIRSTRSRDAKRDQEAELWRRVIAWNRIVRGWPQGGATRVILDETVVAVTERGQPQLIEARVG